jgi:hypothetical protein
VSDNDVEELLRGVEATIKDVEQHLGVPTGVLGDESGAYVKFTEAGAALFA